MHRTRKMKYLVAATACAVAAVTMIATPAMAKTYKWYTEKGQNGKRGASVKFNSKTGVTTVCDTAADDFEAALWIETAKGKQMHDPQVDTGANNGCNRLQLRYSPGKLYRFHLCMAQPTGLMVNCTTWHYVRTPRP
ncbi:hypothetical protein DSM104299_05448 [Baekduia alba]|uniref:hypothetical protein n=1 Tax=Baekduia alba TaxID=2997333 RepID=UPI002340A7A1|nr:hypothetical protein [Baekduia alba]WCB96682.1 hypothetical protein DSM104299_05448 [Baekduia alba]